MSLPLLHKIAWQDRRVRGAAFVAILAFGLILTVGMWWVARSEAERAQEARREANIAEAVGGVQTFVDGIERVLVDTRLFAAEAGYDPARFTDYADRLVDSNPMLNGVALIDPTGEPSATSGAVSRLAVPAESATDPRLVSYVRSEDGYLLGFVGGVDGAHQVYVEVIARDGQAVSGERLFALVVDDERVLAGNVTTSDRVTGPVAELAIGGVAVDLYLQFDATDRLAGFSLPVLLLLGGSSLTLALAFAIDNGLRRGTLISGLVAEQTALARALDEQKTLELELRKAQQQWDAVLRDSPDVIAVVGEEHTLDLLNSEDLVGYQAAALAEKEGLWRLLDTEDRRRFGWLVAVSRSMYERGEVKETAFALRTADGSQRWFSIRLTCTETDKFKGPSETIATFTDIHDRWTRNENPVNRAVHTVEPEPDLVPDRELAPAFGSDRERRGQLFG